MIYVIYCDQSRMVKDVLKQNLAKNFGEIDDLNYTQLDMKSSSLRELGEECFYLPFGCEKKAVVAEDFYYLEKVNYVLNSDDSEQVLLDYLKEPQDDIFLYLLVYVNKLPKSNKLHKALVKAGCEFKEITQLDEKGWNLYIPRFFAKRGIEIDLDASAEFVRRIDGDYAKFLTDSDKLLTYAVDSRRIRLRDIEELVSAPLEERTYLITTALVNGNNAEALRIYNDLKKFSIQEVVILRTLESQFRFFNMVEHCYLDEGMSAQETASVLDANPYRVKVTMKDVQRMRRGRAQDMLEELYEIEKGIMTGKLDSALALTLLLAQFDPRD